MPACAATANFASASAAYFESAPASAMADAMKLKLLQANLESMVQQLDGKTKEAAAAAQEVANQKALVQQITKKLDVSPEEVEQAFHIRARLEGGSVAGPSTIGAATLQLWPAQTRARRTSEVIGTLPQWEGVLEEIWTGPLVRHSRVHLGLVRRSRESSRRWVLGGRRSHEM